LSFSPRAIEDIEAARDFYEVQQVGVGDYFVDSLLSDIERLGDLSGIHPKHFHFHRMLANHFPFAIYYRESPSQTEVLPFSIYDVIQPGCGRNFETVDPFLFR
jgi:plasmid stabilization system protein ParE